MFVFAFLRALRHLPYQQLAVATDLLALAWLTGHAPRLATLTGHAQAAGLIWLAGALAFWFAVRLAPEVSSGARVRRRDVADRVSGGVATWTEIAQFAGKSAMRRKARILRKAERRTRGFWGRLFFRWSMPVTGYAVPLLRTGWLPVGNTIWSSCEDVTLRIGGPRSGKTGSLATHALDAPGALLVTTTRQDLLESTGPARARVGRVVVFNPTGIAGIPSTARWNPLTGCTDYATAMRRAGDLIPVKAKLSESERWDEQARGLLTTLLYAAALAGGSMRNVLRWVSPADVTARDEVLDILRDHARPGELDGLDPADLGEDLEGDLLSPGGRWNTDPVDEDTLKARVAPPPAGGGSK